MMMRTAAFLALLFDLDRQCLHAIFHVGTIHELQHFIASAYWRLNLSLLTFLA
jgi:hypothetical protein